MTLPNAVRTKERSLSIRIAQNEMRAQNRPLLPLFSLGPVNIPMHRFRESRGDMHFLLVLLTLWGIHMMHAERYAKIRATLGRVHHLTRFVSGLQVCGLFPRSTNKHSLMRRVAPATCRVSESSFRAAARAANAASQVAVSERSKGWLDECFLGKKIWATPDPEWRTSPKRMGRRVTLNSKEMRG